MPYAQVVLGLPVEGPFDYIAPPQINQKINPGQRVSIDFRNKKVIGYVTGITAKSRIKNVKPILEIIDEYPVLSRNMLTLTKELSDYYCCSWGEAIETALPEALRLGKKVSQVEDKKLNFKNKSSEAVLIHNLGSKNRWDIYLRQIKTCLENSRSAIIIFPDINAALRAKDYLCATISNRVAILYRKQPKELEQWLALKSGKFDIVVGTRSAIFAPLNNLGLIIIDEEEDFVYKQDQVPHYHTRQVAFMRAKIEKARLLLGSNSPSLEAFYLAQKKKIGYSFIFEQSLPEIKVLDIKGMLDFMRRNKTVLIRYLEDEISRVLNSGGKVLIFLNRKGFATFLCCQHCGKLLKCPRCNMNLVYHFKDNLLRCHHCNFKMQPPKICPDCNSGYIKYSGIGAEKIESELSRIFPQAKVKSLEDIKGVDINSADIFVATGSILKEENLKFDLTLVLAIDNSLHRMDLRAAEKVFALLAGLIRLTKEKLIIQTVLPQHHSLRALEKKDINIFYDQELKHRKQLKFPPYKHLVLIKIRGKNEDRVAKMSNLIFIRLKGEVKDKDIKIISLSYGQPAKLRGNFYWQILLKGDSPKKITKFLKINLKKLSHSGIIVTVDVDPI